MKRINIMLTERLIKEVKEIKKVTGLSRSEIIRKALDYYIRNTSTEPAPLLLELLAGKKMV